MKEMISEVTKNDKFLRLRPLGDFYENPELIHRSACLLLFNNKGELLVQKRGGRKKWFPGRYDFSVGGIVGGESYESCLDREIKELFGVEIFFDEAFKFYNENYAGKSFSQVHVANFVGELKPDSIEVESVRWISIFNLKKEMKNSPEKFTPQFIEGMKIYLEPKHGAPKKA